MKEGCMVSIVIPYYNASAYIEQCIGSVLCQSYKDWEIILVNDGSEEKEFAVIERLCNQDSRIRCISLPHCGSGAARNIGIKEASGRYIAFLDADDFWINDKALEELIFYMQLSNAVICGGERKTLNNGIL